MSWYRVYLKQEQNIFVLVYMKEECGSLDREPHPDSVLKAAAKRTHHKVEDFYMPYCKFAHMMNIGGARPSEENINRHIELWGQFP